MQFRTFTFPQASHRAFKSYQNFQDFQNYYIEIFKTFKNFKLRVKLEAIPTICHAKDESVKSTAWNYSLSIGFIKKSSKRDLL